ncbi:hypothetical protein FRC19_001545 [Serendipita sp. 401]|nr:hypothetical protein FRC19_001545 [Serendipita sp. 401]KAG9055629.1 hypothetical protein FS842_001694 [Serendipita sp. 407]
MPRIAPSPAKTPSQRQPPRATRSALKKVLPPPKPIPPSPRSIRKAARHRGPLPPKKATHIRPAGDTPHVRVLADSSPFSPAGHRPMDFPEAQDPDGDLSQYVNIGSMEEAPFGGGNYMFATFNPRPPVPPAKASIRYQFASELPGAPSFLGPSPKGPSIDPANEDEPMEGMELDDEDLDESYRRLMVDPESSMILSQAQFFHDNGINPPQDVTPFVRNAIRAANAVASSPLAARSQPARRVAGVRMANAWSKGKEVDPRERSAAWQRFTEGMQQMLPLDSQAINISANGLAPPHQGPGELTLTDFGRRAEPVMGNVSVVANTTSGNANAANTTSGNANAANTTSGNANIDGARSANMLANNTIPNGAINPIEGSYPFENRVLNAVQGDQPNVGNAPAPSNEPFNRFAEYPFAAVEPAANLRNNGERRRH